MYWMRFPVFVSRVAKAVVQFIGSAKQRVWSISERGHKEEAGAVGRWIDRGGKATSYSSNDVIAPTHIHRHWHTTLAPRSYYSSYPTSYPQIIPNTPNSWTSEDLNLNNSSPSSQHRQQHRSATQPRPTHSQGPHPLIHSHAPLFLLSLTPKYLSCPQPNPVPFSSRLEASSQLPEGIRMYNKKSLEHQSTSLNPCKHANTIEAIFECVISRVGIVNGHTLFPAMRSATPISST